MLLTTLLYSTSNKRIQMKFISNCLKVFLFIFIFSLIIPLKGFSQFAPIAITGFNHDVVAESGTSSLTTTTTTLDGVTVSNKVIYTQTFRTLNSFGGGGIPDNGIINSGSDSYQLAPYNSSNALVIPRSQNADINLITSAKYSTIRILAFSTEGSSLVNATLFFSDGSQTSVLSNYSLGDWFNNTGNLVLSGFGRCTRATPASGADAFPNNPRMYYINIPLSCTDRQKNLQRINFANVTTAGNNAPYPNLVIMAMSGISYSQQITSVINNASCSAGGNVTLNVTGSSSPYNISWNTIPVQTSITATNLTPGNYTATISDAGSCISTFQVTIGLTNDLTMTVHADTAICSGTSFNANTISNASNYNWSPVVGVSNITIANPVLSPTAGFTTYTVTGTTGTCTISRSFTVTVNPLPILNVHADTTICLGASFNSNGSGNATSYNWLPVTGVSDVSVVNPILSPTILTNYTVTAITGNCSTTKSFKVDVVPGVTVSAGNDRTIIEGQTIQLTGSGSQGNYLWTPSTGLSATNILNPKANPLVTTTYTLRITSQQSCTGTADVIITVVPYCIKAMNAITPNGDGINDRWLVTNGNCISNASVHVYNRYGNPVYENRDYKNDWQGTYKGKPLPDGTYYFVIEYKLLDGRDVFLRGNLTIIR